MCNNVWYDDTKFDYFTGKLFPLPCGYCAGCRIDRRALWERRLTSEYVQQRCAFVCFTYDDYHLVWRSGASRPSVSKEHLHKFLDSFRHKVHSLRELPEHCYYDYKVFAVSEYGEKNLRPHYHALFFGLDWLYFKNLFQDYWQYGNVDVGPILSGGLRYPLKYIDKQQSPVCRDTLYHDVGVDSTFSIKSPGIGADYFVSQVDNINRYGALKIGARLVPCPSYWKNKLFTFCDKNLYSVRSSREKYIDQITSSCRAHGYNSYDDFLRQSRASLELSLEKQARKRHEAFISVSDMLPHARLTPERELVLFRTRNFFAS